MTEKDFCLMISASLLFLVLIVLKKRRPKKPLISVETEVISIFEKEKEIAAERKAYLKKARIKSMYNIPNVVYIYKQEDGYLGTGIMNYHFCLDGPGVYVVNYSLEEKDVYTWYDLQSETSVQLFKDHISHYAKNYFGNT